ncbi:hypothetical protein PRZ61_06620 [Halomonas pacifica]|nr:hypothetical protein [Halomonas pacifica]MDC8803114.1 hypothetical protein [Halomonas pacifica]
MTQAQDQAGLLGQGDKFTRQHQASLGMLPAQQAFGAEQSAPVVHLGLQIESQLVAIDGLAQRRLQAQASLQGLLHGVIEGMHPLVAPLFCFVQGQAGASQQGGIVPIGHPEVGEAGAELASVTVPLQVIAGV